MLLVNRIFTPLGPLVVAADDKHLFLLEFADRRMLQTQIARLAKRLDCSICPGENQQIVQTNREVSEYFSGLAPSLRCLCKCRVRNFNRRCGNNCWPFRMDIPATTRRWPRLWETPVRRGPWGRANGDNRLVIATPCHRVVAGRRNFVWLRRRSSTQGMAVESRSGRGTRLSFPGKSVAWEPKSSQRCLSPRGGAQKHCRQA